jgi:hypothetical protein
MLKLARLMPTALDADRADPASTGFNGGLQTARPNGTHQRHATGREQNARDRPKIGRRKSRSIPRKVCAARHLVPGIFIISTLSNGL